MKNIILSALFTFCLSAVYFAQPGNDNCAGAFSLTVSTSCSYLPYGNIGATDEGLAYPSCGYYSGDNDVWFTFTVPSSGKVEINSSYNGGMFDGAMALYSGTCGSLSELVCEDNFSGMPTITYGGLTPGQTMYIRFWGNYSEQGTFDICVVEKPVYNHGWESFLTGPNSVSGGGTSAQKYTVDNDGSVYAMWTELDSDIGFYAFYISKYEFGSWNIHYTDTIFTQTDNIVLDHKNGSIYVSLVEDDLPAKMNVYRIFNGNVSKIVSDFFPDYFAGSKFDFKVGNLNDEFYWLYESSGGNKLSIANYNAGFNSTIVTPMVNAIYGKKQLQVVGDTLWIAGNSFGNALQLFKTHETNISFYPAELDPNGYVYSPSSNPLRGDSCFILSNRTDRLTLVAPEMFNYTTIEKTYVNNGTINYTNSFPEYLGQVDGSYTNSGDSIFLLTRFSTDPFVNDYYSTKVLFKDYNTDFWDTLGPLEEQVFISAPFGGARISFSPVTKFSSAFSNNSNRFVASYYIDGKYEVNIYNDKIDSTSLIIEDTIFCANNWNFASMYNKFSLSDVNNDSLIILNVTSSDQSVISDTDIDWNTLYKLGNRTYFDILAKNAYPGTTTLTVDAYDGFDTITFHTSYTVLDISVSSTTDDFLCGDGTKTITATPTYGSINWYANYYDTFSIDTLTNSFTTGTLTSDTVFYVEAVYGACTSYYRDSIVITYRVKPTVVSYVPTSSCGNGSFTISATASTGSSIYWYDQITGGTYLGFGNNFTTPYLTDTAYYYAEAYDGYCGSDRQQVSVDMWPVPVFTSVQSGFTCGDGPVTLTASVDAGSVSWYDSINLTTLLFTGDTFVTNSLSANTTYYAYGGNGYCGTPVTAVVAEVKALPTFSSKTDGSRCGTGTVNLSAVASSGTISWFNTRSGGTAIGSGSFFTTPIISSTRYYYLEIYDGFCTTSRDSILATINTIPIISFATVSSPSTCGATDGFIEVSGVGSGTLSWNGTSSGSTPSSTTLPYTVTGLDGGTYNFTFNNGVCSSAVISTTITSPSSPSTPTVTASGLTTFCDGGSVTLTSSSSSSYLWTSGETTQSIVVTAGGSYGVTVTNAAGCSASSANLSVIVNTAPSISLGTVTNPSTCGATDGSIEITGAGTGTLSWTGSLTGSISTSLPYTLSSLGSGTYNFTFNDGCESNILSQNITEPSPQTTPTITASGATTFCDGGSVVLSSSPAANYLWSGGETTQSITVTAAGNYSVTATNASGCSASSAALSVTVNTAPSISLGIVTNPSTCGAPDGSIEITGTGTGTLSWTGSLTGSISTSLPYTLSSLGSGTYNFTFNDACESNILSQNITEPSPQTTPTITASGATTFCDGGSVVLTSSPAANYLWSGGETTQSITVTAAGNYSVTATNASGCSASSTALSVTVNTAPSISFGSFSNPSTCNASDGFIEISGTGNGTLHYNGTQTGSTFVSLPSFLNILPQGTYNFYLDNGCISNTITKTLIDPVSPIVPTITVNGSSTFCEGESVLLTSTLSDSYLWSNGETTQSIVVTNAGNYTVTVTNISGCSETSLVTTINTIPAPIISTGSISNPSVCGASDGSIQVLGSGTGTIFWTGTDNGSATSITLPHLISGLGQGSYNIRFDNGCLSDTLFVVLSDPGAPVTPIITASGPTTFCSGESVVLSSSSPTGNVWSNGETTQSILVTSSGTFNVTNSISGCSSSSLNTNVTVNTTPTLVLGTTINPSLCGSLDGTIEIIGLGTGNVSWSGASTGSVTNVTLPYFVSGLGAGSYYINFVSPTGCSSDTLTTTLFDPGTPSIPIITANGSTTFCTGSNVILTSSAVNNNVWSTGETTQSIVVTSSGNYSVDVVISGCTSTSSSISVTVNNVPNITLGNVNNPSFCGASDGSIEILGSGIGDVVWNGASSGSALGVTLPYTLTNLNQSSYTISFNDGCTSNELIQVLNDPGAPNAPIITVTGSTTFCSGGSVTLSSSYSTGNTWSTGETTQVITVTSGGNYNVSVESLGCSSTSLNELIIVNNTSTSIDNQIACNTFTWIDGNTYTSSNNTATFTLTNAVGCDSIVTLNLTINNSSVGVDTRVACDSYTWIDGNTYTSSNNTATFTLTNAAGCDSIVTLNLTINNSSVGVDTQVACDSYTWIDGNTYTSSNNTATFTLTNAAGCDSIVTLNLTINNSTAGVDTQVACDSYTWIDGNVYTSSNNSATFTLSNAVGCDSIITLNLTINNSTSGIDTQIACGSFTWIDGITYTSSNSIATDTIFGGGVNGCDSIVTLNLTIIDLATGTDSQVACESYTWIDGNTYTSNNNTATFTIVGGGINGCDSIVTLNLTINNPSTGIDTQVACGSYTWIDGNTYSSSNNTAMFTIVGGGINGCDSIVTLDLTINNTLMGVDTQVACGSYTWIDGNTYTSSNNIAMFTVVGGGINGCDSIVTLNLTINNPSTGVDTQVACETYTWIDGTTYTSSNNTATFMLTNAAGCDSIVTLNLTILPKPAVFTTQLLEVCESESLILSASSTSPTILWFDGATSQNEIGEGFTFETPFITSNSTYYVEARENGCSSDRLAIAISMNGKPQISLTSTNSNCDNTDGSASASIVGGSSPYTYYWSNGEQNVLDIFNLATGSYYFNVEDDKGCKSLAVTEVTPSNIDFNPTIINPSCFGSTNGSINLNVSGLSGQLAYLWNNGGSTDYIDNLVAGTYEVTITSETGCIVTSSFELVQPNQISFDFTTIQPDCGDNNGQIQLTNLTGGNGNYLYNWSSGQTTSTINNLTYGIYAVSVKDQNNCFETKSIMLSEINTPIVEAVITNPDCNQANGSIDLNVTPINGDDVASISWSNGASTEDLTSINKGYYTSIITTNSGCIAVNGWGINNKLPQTQEICLVTVDSVTTTNLVVWEKVQLQGISHYNIYRESNQIDDYQLIDTVQFNNLSVFNDVVASPKVRSWRYKIAAVDVCGNESILSNHHKTVHLNTFNLGASGTKVTWDKYEGNLSFSSYVLWRHTDDLGWELVTTLPTSVVSFTDNALASTPGLDYMVEVEIDEICTATVWRAQDFDVSRSNKNKGIFKPGTGVEGFSNNSLVEFEGQNITMNVYPNPFESKFNLELNGTDKIDIELFDISGKLISSMTCKKGVNELNLENVQDGVYFIRTRLNKDTKTIKVIKQ